MTGNCTFPHTGDGATFATLAVCSRCTDITANLGRSKDGDDVLFSLPSGAKARVRKWPDPVVAVEIADFEVDSLTLKSDMIWPFYTMKAVVLRQTNYTAEPDNPFCNNSTVRLQWENHSAASCSLLPCVKTFGAKMENEVYSENELSARYLRKPSIIDSVGPYSYRLLMDPIIRDGVWSTCNWTPKSTAENIIEVYASEVSTSQQQIMTGDTTCGEGTNTIRYPPSCLFGAGQAVGTKLQELHDRLNNTTVETLDDKNIEYLDGESYLRRLYLGDSTGSANMVFRRLMAGLVTA